MQRQTSEGCYDRKTITIEDWFEKSACTRFLFTRYLQSYLIPSILRGLNYRQYRMVKGDQMIIELLCSTAIVQPYVLCHLKW